MVHVVHVEAGRHLYGGARQVLLLLEGLGAEGIRNTLICPPGSDIAAAADARVNVETLPIAGDHDALFAVRFARWLRAHPADLVHVHSRRGADAWGGLAARQAGVPAVLSRRVDNPERGWLRTYKYRAYERVIGISARIVDELTRAGIPAAKLRLVHSAVDAAACEARHSRDAFLAVFDLPADALVVACVAQFIDRKGHADLLAAWPAVLARVPRARLLLFGRGPLEAEFRRVAADAGLESSVHFCGFRADLREWLGCADLLAHPAHREGLGIAVLEAQAAGLAVVAARAGGIPEVVADGVTGLLHPPGDWAALGEALATLLDTPQRRQEMGAAGAARVRQQFSPGRMVSGNLAVYREVLGAQVRAHER